jgi:membrane fusion protein (multidrug efflux system)
LFPVSVRAALDLSQRYAANGGFGAAVIKVRLSNGQMYERIGKIDFVDNTVAANTDTITLRGTLPNPELSSAKGPEGATRGLIDGALVTVVVEDAQAGDYVYVVDAQNTVRQQRIRLGQSAPTMAVIASGLSEGDSVIVEGIQRVRPGLVVSPAPAGAPPGEPAAPPRS